jgi:hypothetical protein
MLNAVKQEASKRNNILLILGLFILFLGLYIFLDFEGNTNYKIMADTFGITIVLIHIIINTIFFQE